MFERIETLRMAQAMTDHAARRQNLAARNVANADTPGYKAADLDRFSEAYHGGFDRMAMAATRAGHLADPFWSAASTQVRVEREGASPDGNTVSLEDEMIRAAEIRSENDTALAIYRSGIDLLRTSIGRRG